jgi:predicted nucleic-acid-binding Zn-ribbon protein
MVPLYAARIQDLGPGDFVKVECTACGHTELLTAGMLSTAGVKPFQNILDLKYKLRCRECDRRGQGGGLDPMAGSEQLGV